MVGLKIVILIGVGQDWAGPGGIQRGIGFAQVIHEFDPYFNYRTTKYLSSEGFYDFLNWFDDRAWYPLGRIIGGTIYPGLMATAASIHAVLNFLNISINVRNMCVFLAPVFAANTAIATYLMTTEVRLTPPSTRLLGLTVEYPFFTIHVTCFR